MGSPFPIALLCYFPMSSDSLISQSGSFVLPAVMGCTRIALLSRSTLTHGIQCHRFRARGLEEPPTSFRAIPRCIKKNRSLIGQFDCFALPAVLGGTWIALHSESTLSWYVLSRCRVDSDRTWWLRCEAYQLDAIHRMDGRGEVAGMWRSTNAKPYAHPPYLSWGDSRSSQRSIFRSLTLVRLALGGHRLGYRLG